MSRVKYSVKPTTEYPWDEIQLQKMQIKFK